VRAVNPGFVGRGDELGRLEQLLDQARAGTAATVLVGGDPGIGKSSLLAEAAGRFAARMMIAPCVRMGGAQIPLAPLVTLLRQLQRTDPSLLETAPLLVDWVRPGAETTPRHTDVLAAALDLVIAASETASPLLLVVEDVHWADAATWDLIDHLARNLAASPVVLAATYRTPDAIADPDLRRRIGELGRLAQVSRITLRGWTPTEVADRLEHMLGAPAPSPLAAEIAQRGGGNPFFTQELLAARQAGTALPEVVADLITSDLARLDSPTRSVVSALAVLGRPADDDLLVAVAGLDTEPERAIRDAVSAGLVVVEESLYQVRHALIAEVAYLDLLPGERRRHHRLAANHLTTRASRRATVEHAGELAVHLDRAGDIDGAFVALLVAADASEAVAPAAALEHLLRAIDLWDDAHERSNDENLTGRLWQAADLASATRGNDLAIELAERALDVGPPPRGWAWGHERLGRYLWSAGRIDDSTVEFERAYQMIDTADDDGFAPVLAGLGQAELMRGNYDAAESCCRRALDHLPEPDTDLLAWVMANRVLGLVVSHRGEPDVGIAMCRRSVVDAPTAHTRHLASIYLVLAQLAAGRYDAAAGTALEASADARLSGTDRSFGGYLDALAAEALIRLGRWVEARGLLARHTPGDTVPVGEIRLAIAAAKLAARTGDTERARALLADATKHDVDSWHNTYLIAGVADVELVAGDWARAAEAAERGMSSPAGSLLLWQARFTTLLVQAEVERALDRAAAKEPVDLAGTAAGLTAKVTAVRDVVAGLDSTQLSEVLAYLQHAAAAIGRIHGPDPDAWRSVGDMWDRLSDAWLTAVSRLREAADAAAVGEARRAEAALRSAHEIATRLASAPLTREVEAVARRTRIDVHAPEVVILPDTTTERLGLTSREAEVLGQLAAGATNREIGERLFISEKTASVHVSHILRKLGVTTRVEAAAVAQRLGLG
jgi:DNA-binding CsgD family transcriptional regulator